MSTPARLPFPRFHYNPTTHKFAPIIVKNAAISGFRSLMPSIVRNNRHQQTRTLSPSIPLRQITTPSCSTLSHYHPLVCRVSCSFRPSVPQNMTKRHFFSLNEQFLETQPKAPQSLQQPSLSQTKPLKPIVSPNNIPILPIIPPKLRSFSCKLFKYGLYTTVYGVAALAALYYISLYFGLFEFSGATRLAWHNIRRIYHMVRYGLYEINFFTNNTHANEELNIFIPNRLMVSTDEINTEKLPQILQTMTMLQTFILKDNFVLQDRATRNLTNIESVVGDTFTLSQHIVKLLQKLGQLELIYQEQAIYGMITDLQHTLYTINVHAAHSAGISVLPDDLQNSQKIEDVIPRSPFINFKYLEAETEVYFTPFLAILYPDIFGDQTSPPGTSEKIVQRLEEERQTKRFMFIQNLVMNQGDKRIWEGIEYIIDQTMPIKTPEDQQLQLEYKAKINTLLQLYKLSLTLAMPHIVASHNNPTDAPLGVERISAIYQLSPVDRDSIQQFLINNNFHDIYHTMKYEEQTPNLDNNKQSQNSTSTVESIIQAQLRHKSHGVSIDISQVPEEIIPKLCFTLFNKHAVSLQQLIMVLYNYNLQLEAYHNYYLSVLNDAISLDMSLNLPEITDIKHYKKDNEIENDTLSHIDKNKLMITYNKLVEVAVELKTRRINVANNTIFLNSDIQNIHNLFASPDEMITTPSRMIKTNNSNSFTLYNETEVGSYDILLMSRVVDQFWETYTVANSAYQDITGGFEALINSNVAYTGLSDMYQQMKNDWLVERRQQATREKGEENQPETRADNNTILRESLRVLTDPQNADQIQNAYDNLHVLFFTHSDEKSNELYSDVSQPEEIASVADLLEVLKILESDMQCVDTISPLGIIMNNNNNHNIHSNSFATANEFSIVNIPIVLNQFKYLQQNVYGGIGNMIPQYYLSQETQIKNLFDSQSVHGNVTLQQSGQLEITPNTIFSGFDDVFKTPVFNNMSSQTSPSTQHQQIHTSPLTSPLFYYEFTPQEVYWYLLENHSYDINTIKNNLYKQHIRNQALLGQNRDGFSQSNNLLDLFSSQISPIIKPGKVHTIFHNIPGVVSPQDVNANKFVVVKKEPSTESIPNDNTTANEGYLQLQSHNINYLNTPNDSLDITLFLLQARQRLTQIEDLSDFLQTQLQSSPMPSLMTNTNEQQRYSDLELEAIMNHFRNIDKVEPPQSSPIGDGNMSPVIEGRHTTLPSKQPQWNDLLLGAQRDTLTTFVPVARSTSDRY